MIQDFDIPISFFFFGFLYLCYGRGDAAAFKGLTPVRLPLQGRQMEDVRPEMVFYCLFCRGGTTTNKHGYREHETAELNMHSHMELLDKICQSRGWSHHKTTKNCALILDLQVVDRKGRYTNCQMNFASQSTLAVMSEQLQDTETKVQMRCIGSK